ncbi:hypothetical protein GFY24_40010 [Nocardia sp. SYP-A9097]|uniref:hypothetical protein n=1 Tax=Nocardia sp. SYP-A9097 TaxID=2663237 RepID=UPI00129B1882|nr:hypothetical protein [Nocardia sp. SYP-A9097]MRH93513.1 hypothetical protein [Nocardia sp. SYP-A9097]
MAQGNSSGRRRGLTIDEVHWHILREDQHRASVSARTASVLSTNALVVAGTALANSIRGVQRLSAVMVCSTIGTLAFVAASVVLASMALVTPRRWTPKRDDVDFDSSMVYHYGYYGGRWATFEDFRASITDLSPEQQLHGAVLELWKASYTHQYRYRKLRMASRYLIGAIVLLVITVALAAILR